MIANINNLSRIYEFYPSRYVHNGVTIDGYNLLDEATHISHGWRNIVSPNITEFQRLGIIFYDNVNEIITYPVINFTQEEIEALNIQKVAEKTLEIYNIYEDLYTSSLARAVSKVGQGLTREHLNNLREEYNDVSILSQAYLNDGTILNQKAFQDITDEMNLDFPVPVLDQTVAYLNSVYTSNPVYQIIPTDENTTQIQKFCWLIVNKYNLGEALWTYLKDLCSKFRKRMITNLDNFEFDKYESRMLLVKSITNETTIEQIQQLETQFDAI